MTGKRFPPALFLPEGPDWAQWAGGRGQVSTGHLPHARPFSRLLNPLSGRGERRNLGWERAGAAVAPEPSDTLPSPRCARWKGC